jgi:hypothetical protein
MAVVSQPSDRAATIPAPGALDNSLGEFWVENPWDIVDQGHNLSAFERNRVFLNVQGKSFLDISYLSGADDDGDGRSIVAADFRNTGQMDLLVRQAGGDPPDGGTLLLYENHFPKKHYLHVSLNGHKSNRLGIGAKLIAEVKGQKIYRDLYPINSYRSQMLSQVHFGLGDATQIDKLTIRWPSGKEQVLTNLDGDRHILVDEDKEGESAIRTYTPGEVMKP